MIGNKYTIDELQAMANEALDSMDCEEFASAVEFLTGRKFRHTQGPAPMMRMQVDLFEEEVKYVCNQVVLKTCDGKGCSHGEPHFGDTACKQVCATHYMALKGIECIPVPVDPCPGIDQCDNHVRECGVAPCECIKRIEECPRDGVEELDVHP